MKKLKAPPLSAEVTEQYRGILLSCGIPPECVDRLLSREGIEKLRKAQLRGIRPENILVLCRDSFANRWKHAPLLEAEEAHDTAAGLRKATRKIRSYLRRAIFEMPEPQLHEELYPLTRSDSVVEFGTLFTPERMNMLWDVVGRDNERGHLGELAEAFDRIADILKGMPPRHRFVQLGIDHFIKFWGQLARRSNPRKRPCDDLGSWFLKATFGLKTTSVKTDTDWFRKMRERAVARPQKQTATHKPIRRDSSSTESLDTPPPDNLDTTTWARKEAERVKRKFPGKKVYQPPRAPR